MSPSSPSIPRLATPPTHEWQRWHLAKLLRVFSCRVAFVWVLGVLDKVQCTFEDRSDIENRRRPRTAARPAEQPGIEREEPRVATEGARPMYMLNADREDWMHNDKNARPAEQPTSHCRAIPRRQNRYWIAWRAGLRRPRN